MKAKFESKGLNIKTIERFVGKEVFLQINGWGLETDAGTEYSEAQTATILEVLKYPEGADVLVRCKGMQVALVASDIVGIQQVEKEVVE